MLIKQLRKKKVNCFLVFSNQQLLFFDSNLSNGSSIFLFYRYDFWLVEARRVRYTIVVLFHEA